jgi:hypothetical protein
VRCGLQIGFEMFQSLKSGVELSAKPLAHSFYRDEDVLARVTGGCYTLGPQISAAAKFAKVTTYKDEGFMHKGTGDSRLFAQRLIEGKLTLADVMVLGFCAADAGIKDGNITIQLNLVSRLSPTCSPKACL